MGGRTFQPSPTRVTFNKEISSYRQAHDDERYVMQNFALHASHCPTCNNPFRVHMSGGTLCDRGHSYARDVFQYISTKAGVPFSVIDQNRTGERVQLEIPAVPGSDSLRGLLKAVDRGLRIHKKGERAQKERVIVEQNRSLDPRYPVAARFAPAVVQARTERREDSNLIEIRPSSRREERRERSGRKAEGRGSLYRYDEEQKRRREREALEPVIIIAEPGRRYNR